MSTTRMTRPNRQADADVADDLLAPRPAQQTAAALDCLDRADALDCEDGHDEERGHVPGEADDADDDRADEAGALRDHPQDHAHGRRDHGVADDLGQARERNSEAIAHGRIPAIESDQSGTDQRRLEEERDGVGHDVEQEQHRRTR